MKTSTLLTYMKNIVVAIVLAASMLVSSSASAQNTKTQETKRNRLQQEIEVLDRQLKDNETKSSNALYNLTLVRKKISNRQELVAESDREIAEIASQIGTKQKEIAAIQSRLDTMSYYYERLVKSAYKNRDARVWYMYILASDNLSQAFRRIGYLRGLSSQMNVQATKIKEVKAELEQEQQKLAQLKAEAEKMRSDRVAELDKLKVDESSSESLVAQLKKDKNKIQKDINSKQRQVESLNREIEKIIRDAMNASSKSGSKSSSSKTAAPIDYTLASEFKANKGKLPWPVSGPVVDKFGQHYHPVYKNIKLPMNNGLDIATDKNAQVKAVFDGVVKQILVMPGYNQCLLVQHGDYFSFYCKLGTVNVKAGDKIKTGQVVGTVDTINGETRFHLEIWSGRTPQNPEIWLRPR